MTLYNYIQMFYVIINNKIVNQTSMEEVTKQQKKHNIILLHCCVDRKIQKCVKTLVY